MSLNLLFYCSSRFALTVQVSQLHCTFMNSSIKLALVRGLPVNWPQRKVGSSWICGRDCCSATNHIVAITPAPPIPVHHWCSVHQSIDPGQHAAAARLCWPHYSRLNASLLMTKGQLLHILQYLLLKNVPVQNKLMHCWKAMSVLNSACTKHDMKIEIVPTGCKWCARLEQPHQNTRCGRYVSINSGTIFGYTFPHWPCRMLARIDPDRVSRH